MDQGRLEYTDSAGTSHVVPIDANPFLIGRSTSNHLAVSSAEVSRDHAEIVWVDDRFVLRERALKSGDTIRVGPTVEIRFAVGTRDPSSSLGSGSTTAIPDLRQTAMLLEGLRALGSARVLDHVLDLVLDSAIEVSGAERGFLMLVAEDQTLEFKTGRRRDKRSLSVADFKTSRKIPEQVFRTGETRLIEDLFESDLAQSHDETVRMGIRNVLCAPLRTIHYVDSGETAEGETAPDDRRIGVLYLDSRERKSFKSSAIRTSLETLANEAASAIENARLYRDSQEKARLEQDLQTAHEFQQALLPKAAPNLGFFETAASMVPCRMIGGDFFDYVPLEDGTLGDVAGKGAPAGLLGARIQEIFSAHAPTVSAPATTIARINSTLLRRALESRFVTMFYGLLYPDGRLRYCNAGHNPPMLVTSSGVRRLETGGLIVGLFDDAVFEEETIQLTPGDLLVIFNDGISEATNHAGEEYGDDRIIRSVEASFGVREPEAVLHDLFEHLATFTVDELQGDDMTALILRYSG